VLDVISIERGWQGLFLAVYLVALIAACLVAAPFLAPLETWKEVGPLLLFLGLLTLLNAPFDWASLGLTRALLRRGVELGGWVPFGLALLDALFATGFIVALALVMVVFVQAFDELAAYGGGAEVLPLGKLFDGIAANPAAPEFWWVYALLLSTMLPSLFNLMIAWTSMLRGIPGLPRLLLPFIPDGKVAPIWERRWLALVLTGQLFVGGFLGILFQGVLAWCIIAKLMPAVELDLLELARWTKDQDIPARAAQLFTGGH
jgi:hypothetical protein